MLIRVKNVNVKTTSHKFQSVCSVLSRCVLVFCQLEEEEGFKEFLSVHQNRSQAPTWANDMAQETAAPGSRQAKNKKPSSDDYLNFDSDESEDGGEDEDDDDDGEG